MMNDGSVLVYCNVGVSAYGYDFFHALYVQVLKEVSLPDDFNVEVTLVSKDCIREVNREQRNNDKVTDVLSFPALNFRFPYDKNDYLVWEDPSDGRISLGDILICRDVAAEQAEEYGHSEDREVAYLFVHGMLHLLGFDHEKEEDKKVMREREENVLHAMGIDRI